MPQSINIAARDWAPGRYERTIDTVPADATGVAVEFDCAAWPARYYPDPLGPLAEWELAYSADGVSFEVVGFGELWNVQNPRNGVTIVRISAFFPQGANLSQARRNPNQVRAAMTVFETINTPVKLNWLNTAATRSA